MTSNKNRKRERVSECEKGERGVRESEKGRGNKRERIFLNKNVSNKLSRVQENVTSFQHFSSREQLEVLGIVFSFASHASLASHASRASLKSLASTCET